MRIDILRALYVTLFASGDKCTEESTYVVDRDCFLARPLPHPATVVPSNGLLSVSIAFLMY